MQNELETLYHPPLDPALIAAIANDTDDIDDAKATLDILQAEAIADGFEDGYTSPTLDFSEDETDISGSVPEELSDALEAEIGDDDNLRFLKLSFPKQSLTTLKFVLHKCQDDVFKAVDELLNRELIDEERRLNAIVDGEQGGTMDDFYTQGDGPARRRRRRKQQGATAAFLPAELNPDKQAPASRWDQMKAEVDWTARVLSLPPATVQSAYHAHNSSLPAALNALIEETTWKHTPTEEYSEKYEKLHKAHPGLGINKTQNVLNATREDLQLSLEIAHVLAAWRPSLGTIQTDGIKGRPASSAATAAGPSVPASGIAAIASSNKSAAECRVMAAECATKRDEAFRQAARAHQKSKSDGLHGGTAMYYAEIGRDFDAKMRAWNMRAAQLSSTLKSGSSDDLDLHGLSVHEGLAVTKEGLTKWYATTRMLETGAFAKPLRIVTGLGNHSAGGEARLMPAVRKYLDREGWRYSVSGGCISVTSLISK